MDIKIDKNGEDLPLQCAEEAKELLFLNQVWVYAGFATTPVSDGIEQCQWDANVIDPPVQGIGRSELSLADLVGLNSPAINDVEVLVSIKTGYLSNSTWSTMLKMPDCFPKFKISNGLILFMNDSGDPSLVIPDVIHNGEGLRGILTENVHGIIGYFGCNKTLTYM